jgi:hypothetical protein
MHSAITVSMLLSSIGGPILAQAIRYQPSTDTLRYQSLNFYRLYFVRGADTLGEPISTTTRESRYLRRVGAGLELWTRLEGSEGFSAQETYSLTPEGRVTSVGGCAVRDVPNARVDILPRLPTAARSLDRGVQWRDTVSVEGTQSYGATRYQVRRNYRVVRTVDSANARLALIVADGEMKLRQGGWQDSAQGLVWWQEVTGPIADTIWFDTRAGNVHTSVAVMNLSGTGGFGPPGGGISMPSGLRSSVRLTRRN